jgi:polysaccharide export outer membrane protein
MMSNQPPLQRLSTRLLGGLVLAVTTSCAGQTAPPAPELKENPLLALRAFEPSANEAYQLGRGDEISLDFNGRPELSGKKVVGPDGRITLPLAGSIELAGKTREEAAQVIATALTPFYSNITLTVGVDRYTSNRVLLLGAVEHPGVISFDQTPTLLEVITRGGVLTAGGSASGSGVVSPGHAPVVPARCAIYRGSDKVMWVDLKGLLDSGSPLADLRLRRDDVIYVPSPSESYVSVLGQVQHPGAMLLDSSTTLPKLLADAGGLTDLAGHSPDIQIIQPSTGTTRVISFKALLQPNKIDLTLKSGDVVYIPESGFNRSTYVLQRLSPLVTMFTAAAFFAH